MHAKILLMDKNRAGEAAPYLNRVLKAKARVDVTIASQEEAAHLLRKSPIKRVKTTGARREAG